MDPWAGSGGGDDKNKKSSKPRKPSRGRGDGAASETVHFGGENGW